MDYKWEDFYCSVCGRLKSSHYTNGDALAG